MNDNKTAKKYKSKIKCDYRVRLYEDGKYHWMYDLHLLKNPAVLLDVYWMLGVTMAIFACIIFMIQACSDGLKLEGFEFSLKIIGLTAAIMFVLGLLGYLLYAAVSGWTYTVHFIMDENQVVHEQGAKSEKIGKRIAILTILAGLFAKRPSVVGAGALSASRNTMTSEFSSVSKVKAVRWMDTILVKEFLDRNRVYVNKDDFEFVYDYITSRCKNAKIG